MPVTNIRGQQILNGTVQYVDIQQVAANRLVGNPTVSAATMSEISLGTGLSFSGSSVVLSTNLQSLSGLSYSSASFVKMTAAGTFALDTNTYLTAEADTLTSVTGRGASTPSNMTIANANPVLRLKDTDNSGTGVGQVGYISFLDSGDTERAWIGYGSAGSNNFTITNGKGDVVLFASTGVAYVNSNIILHAGNYNSYAPTLTGTGASGTWGINITGNAATVTGFKNIGNIGVQAVAGSSQTCTTAQFLTWYETNFAFKSYYYTVAKCTWDYAGNNDISDTSIGACEMAGTVIETFSDGTYYTIRITRPTTGAGGFVTLVYNDQGSGYSPGWRTDWNSSNLTNLNQLTNGPGYITGESDDLASVTSRGASTSTGVTLSSSNNYFNGHHYFNAYDANGNHYPHYNVGANNNGSKLNLRMYGGNGSTLRLFYLDGNTGGFTWDGNTVWHSGNDGSLSGLDADLLDGNHASAFALVNGNTGQSFGVFELSYALTAFNPSTAPRTALNPMSVKMWDNYFYGIGLGSDYGTVMDYYGRSGHVNTQVYFDAAGGTWYRNSPYNSGWGSWLQYVTNFSTWSIRVRGTDNAYANGLLQSGAGRTDDAAGDTWIFIDSAGSDSNKWGIKHNQLNNRIEFWGNNAVGSYIQMESGFYSGIAALANGANGNFYIDDNYGNSVVGVYSDVRYQGVFAMGDSYKLPADGTTTGSLYGLAWSHPNAGGVAANLNTHGLLVMENGSFLAAISGSIRARDDIRAPIFYDSGNSGYSLNGDTTNSWRVSTPSGYLEIGPKNTSYCHFETDRGNFYFGSRIDVNGELWRYNGARFVENTGTWGISITGSAGLLSVDNAVVFGRSGLQFAQSSSTAGNTATSHQTPTDDWWHVIRMNHANGVGYYADLAVSMTTNLGLARRVISGGGQLSNWVTILDGLNYNSYSPTLTGGNASGTWGISITGSAATVTHYASRVDGTLYNIGWFSGNPSPIYSCDAVQIRSSDGTIFATHYRGSGNVGGTGQASHHPAGVFSEGTNWLYGTIYLNGNTIYDASDIYNNQWFRNNTTNTGLYNQQTTQHWSSKDNGYWDASSTTSVSSIRFWTGSHVGALRGYVYANSSNEIGFLDQAGNWVLRCLTGNSYLTGTFTASGDVVAYSDARIKTNVQTIDNALEKVTSLRGVTYNRTDVDDKSEKIGVIAQEIQKVIPQVVNEGDDGMLGVSYGNLAGVFIEAIKEQQKQIEELKKQIKYLVENR